ncbi:MAG: hypothetical protein DI586_11515 [Micavibrio aeruginosavorus]|uniref:Prepilin peptidase A24 N-terminal domain-containing protein n=1 Tax=Micavibrio aeruginosavorus TaxID=349221 RepID=A0A2W5HGT3_9BACT|nr:MAG: hypothetical protein DI586_11515 [Micavibrio aeruginosavorus]
MDIGLSFYEVIVGFLFGILGLCAGSFSTAIIYRENKNLPWFQLKGEHARSICPSCNTELNFQDLFPVFSWISTQGKCRYCRKKIPLFYPLLELICAVSSILLYLWSGLSVISVTALCCLPFLVSLVYLGLFKQRFSLRLVAIVVAIGTFAFILQLIFN